MSVALKSSVSIAIRKRSACAKVKLLSKGVCDDASLFAGLASFKEDNHAYDNGNWGVGRGRSVPSDLLLPGGIVSKLHIRPDSPLSLENQDGTLVLCENGIEISECELLPQPKFWNLETGAGTPAHKLVQLYGATCLNLNIFSGCQFFNVSKECKFCSVQPTQSLHRAVVVRKSPQELRDACKLAVENDDIQWYLQTGGSHLDSDEEFGNHVAVLRELRHVMPWSGRFRGNLATMPPKDLGRIAELFELGVDHPSFNLEVWPKVAFESICEGKSRYVGFEHILSAMDKLVSLYGPGWGWCNFVAGLVPLEDQKAGFTAVAERGIIPGANVFHPDVGAAFGHSHKSPSEDYITQLYLHAAELYHQFGYKPFFDSSVLRNSLANEAYEGLLD